MWRTGAGPTAELATAVLLLFALGLLTNVAASVVICTNSRPAILVFGAIAVLLAVLLLLSSFVRQPGTKERAVSVATALFCILSACAQFCETDRFRATAPQLSLAVLYAFTAIAVSSLLALLYRFATAYFLPSLLRVRGIRPGDEGLLYVSANFLCAFISAVVVSASDPVNRKAQFDSTGLAYSIAVWFANGVLCSVVGWGLARRRADLTSLYDSTPALVADAPGYADIASHPD
jgi:uncharacterized membrane protein